MRNIGFGQFLVLLFLCFLLFGDFVYFKKKLKKAWEMFTLHFLKNSRKKRN